MTNRLLARLLSPLACTAMVLGTTACAAQDRRLPSPVASSPVAAEDKLSGPALWRMKDEDTTIYLFGTVHVLPKDVVWFDGPIKRAFEASGEMVTEVDTSDVAAMQQQMQGAAKLEGDQTLRELMSAQDRVAFEEALVSLGLPVAGLDQVEPWFAALVLTLLPLNRAGYSPDTGVETALNAMAGDKQRDQFETVQFQVELFDTMPMEQQLAYLRGVVDAVPETVSTLDAMIQEWLAGDIADLGKLLNPDASDKALRERLLSARNRQWADWLDERMEQPGTVFVAVGAGHLAGKDSVQRELGKRGFKVERVLH